jgi:CRP/FNR family cyclic AMP-dependent transcriptional regulator
MDIGLLKKIPLFNTLDDEELTQVIQITKERRFPKGEPIMREGEKGETMYLILDGLVDVSKSLTMKFGDDDFRETEKVITRFKPEDHEVFGEMALIRQDTRSATIVAQTDCLLLEINRGDFLRLVEEHPALGVKVLLRMCESLVARLRRSGGDIARLTTALSIALGR